MRHTAQLVTIVANQDRAGEAWMWCIENKTKRVEIITRQQRKSLVFKSQYGGGALSSLVYRQKRWGVRSVKGWESFAQNYYNGFPGHMTMTFAFETSDDSVLFALTFGQVDHGLDPYACLPLKWKG